ncbi:MAG: FeoA family protein [Thermodesulfobacterium sp. 37_54]|jgi:Fe2+ transport system protein FeoA|nr:MAG: FeoA family protein [Thermodesulfobacterium sp. 37_54]MDK2861436.1 ferrous iron transport protein [Thermodesulfobacterium sp.]HCP10639.1 ferrous iron transport protein A [Thermodesulfobacterium commune]
MLKLSKVNLGKRVKVVSVEGPPSVKQRLKEMGITPGVELQIVRIAPLADPVNVEVRGYHLSIRKKEAELIEVEVIG